MADSSSLQLQLDALLAAFRSGVLTCTYDSKAVTYRSLDQMREAIASLEAALGQSQGGAVVIVANKGW